MTKKIDPRKLRQQQEKKLAKAKRRRKNMRIQQGTWITKPRTELSVWQMMDRRLFDVIFRRWR